MQIFLKRKIRNSKFSKWIKLITPDEKVEENFSPVQPWCNFKMIRYLFSCTIQKSFAKVNINSTVLRSFYFTQTRYKKEINASFLKKINGSSITFKNRASYRHRLIKIFGHPTKDGPSRLRLIGSNKKRNSSFGMVVYLIKPGTTPWL